MKYSREQFIGHLKEIFIMGMIGLVYSLFVGDLNAFNITVTVLIWVFLSRGNGWLVELIDKRISWVDQPVLRLTVGMVAMIVYTVFAFGFILVTTIWYYYGDPPSVTLARLGFENYLVSILITLIISMFLHGRAFYLEWKEALYREEKLKVETLKTKFESLRNQVNPHFLFNSLNVLSGLVYEDQARAVEFIRKMSEVYRYVLDKRDQELVPLEDELKFFDNYAFLQQIRFGENLRVKVTRQGDGMVPPVAMQLLLENAIKHNIVSEAKPLTVTVVIQNGEIKVSNNIQEKLSKDSTGIGLSNLRERYGYLSNKTVQINNDGKTFEVILPLLKIDS
ncbi:MAG: histidine kinase [Flammeovirgaceae bacterium]|nr:histidine kinase [Flammeovirgaceae bacterium]MBR07984.1 histidine kinase [Rickettsiales bacterium]HCX20526.1 histidine kinase [Cytophagales bacterium]|tara:strand:+ start:72 stop:1079 length:1008 start_codon:yes stop_codon:yes gene_type:complete